MRFRLFLFFLPTLYSSVSVATEAAWNCQQSKDGKEWVCVGEAKGGAKTDQAQAPVKSEPAKEAEPAITESMPVAEPAAPADVDKDTTPAPAEPVQVAEPVAPKAVESSQEAPPEPAKEVKPAKEQPIYVAQPVIHESGKPAPIEMRPPSPEAVADNKQRPGWTCDASSEDQAWECNLVGADPKGQAKIVTSDEVKAGLLEPAFDLKQEQTFNTLKSQLPYDPWQNCTIHMGAPAGFVSQKDLRETAPLDIKSNYSELFDAEISSYFGNVEMRRADQHAMSDKANYDTESETLDMQGNVTYSEDELALHSDTALLKLQSDQARLREALFISPSTPLRGRAKVVYRDSKDFSRYKDVAYTSCRPGNQDWIVHASELKLDKVSGRAAAKNTWLEFKGVPVFYSPYLSFPMDDRRLSGFLAPSFGSTQQSGFDFSVPYYWNIAPNYDATVKPRYLTDRGAMLGGNFRYLTEQSRGKFVGEFLPNDDLLNKSRYLAGLQNTTVFTPNISSNLNLNYVSDKDYFSDLGNALQLNRSSYLRSTADVKYINDDVSFITRVENYQTIDKTIKPENQPYRRLPQVKLDLNHSFDFMPLDTAMQNEYVFFQHDKRVNGQRFNIKPSVSVPLQTAGAFLKPKLSLQHTDYLLTQDALRPGSITRTLPIASLDSGLYFEKPLDLAGSEFTHTIEPRLFYLYIPKTDQNDIPLFDTSLYDFNFNSMFRENRFSGADRVQDANQITTAVTSRLIDSKTGREKLKLNVGEIFYFTNRDVTLCQGVHDSKSVCPENSATVTNHLREKETNSFSNLVTEMNAELTEHVSLGTGLQWDPSKNDIVRGDAVIHFINEPDEIINVGYRYRKNTLLVYEQRNNDIIQSDISFHWPVYDDWSAVGRWQYSLLNNSTRESFFGLEKESCCWRFRVIGRRWVNNVNNNSITAVQPQGQGVSQTGIFFQVELKGLTGIGEKLDQFFEQNIYGYRKPLE